MKLRLAGLDEYMRDLAAAPAGVERTIDQAATYAAPDVLSSIQDQTPVRSGDLQREQRTWVDDGDVWFEASMFYATFVNDGTKWTSSTGKSVVVPPNPFVERGVDAERRDTVRTFEAAFDDFAEDFGDE